jgi:hypothetical protein
MKGSEKCDYNRKGVEQEEIENILRNGMRSIMFKRVSKLI